MHHINVVLLEPEIPQNTGNISRTCAATHCSLHLIKPLGYSLDDRYMKRAGLDYWQHLDLHIYENIEDFYRKNPGAVCYYFTTKASACYTDPVYPEDVFLVFGKETKGLPEWLLHDNPDSCVRLPMIDKDSARSLNLSNAVAVGAFEALRQWGYPDMRTEGHLTQYDD